MSSVRSGNHIRDLRHFYSQGALLIYDEYIKIQSEQPEIQLYALGDIELNDVSSDNTNDAGTDTDIFWRSYKLSCERCECSVNITKTGISRYVLSFSKETLYALHNLNEIILEIDYAGDIGMAFIDGDMINDNFYNGAKWELGIKNVAGRLSNGNITIYIAPMRKGAKVDVDSPMAARSENVSENIGELISVNVKPVYEHSI